MVNNSGDQLKLRLSANDKLTQNFNLSRADFNVLLESLRDGNEKLFEHIFLHHFEPCVDYIMRNDDATQTIAYDIVMETIVRFRARLLTGKIQYGNLRFLFTSMARQELRRYRIREGKLAGLPKPGVQKSSEAKTIDAETYRLLSKALKQMGHKCRELLRMYYFVGQNLNDIAQQQDRNAAAVRQQKHRCLEQLRKIVCCFLK